MVFQGFQGSISLLSPYQPASLVTWPIGAHWARAPPTRGAQKVGARTRFYLPKDKLARGVPDSTSR